MSTRSYEYYAELRPRTRLLNTIRRLFQLTPVERWLSGRTRGSPRTSLLAKMVPPEYTYPKGSWRTVERDGSVYRLDLSNTTDHDAFFGFADAGATHLLDALRPTDTVVDIGANIGIRTVGFAGAVPQGRVISIEPDPENFRRLCEHIHANRLTNVTAVNCGIGATEGPEKLYRVVASNSGMNRILPRVAAAPDLPFAEITIKRLQTVLSDAGVNRVDAVKIDVEGYELDVLRGSEEVIQRDAPLLFVELDDYNLRENGWSAAELLQQLAEWGYSACRSDTLEPLDSRSQLTRCHCDIICRAEQVS